MSSTPFHINSFTKPPAADSGTATGRAIDDELSRFAGAEPDWVLTAARLPSALYNESMARYGIAEPVLFG